MRESPKRLAAGLAWLSLVLAMFAATRAGHSEPLPFFQPLVLDGSKVRWSGTALSKGATVSYAFVTRDVTTPGARNCASVRPFGRLLQMSGLDALALRAALVRALQRWEGAADITFVETGDVDGADILVGEQAVPVGRAFANVETRGEMRDGVKEIGRSIVCLNPEARWKVGFDGDLSVYDLVHTLTHEFGHAIGLDHPRGAGHVMSRKYDEMVPALSRGDIAGAVALYGPPRAVRSAAIGEFGARSDRARTFATESAPPR